MHTRQEKIEALGRVIDTLDILRVKCPWDAKQTNESLRPNTIEEVYEPFLIMEGFLRRTPRGREVTSLAYTHLKLREPGRGLFDEEM